MANGKRVEAMRQQLAQTAAQMIQEQGIRDYRLAKEKAAARHGVDIRRGPLPRNTEIEAALAEYQRLFAGADAVGQVAELRRAALQAMRELEAFQPRLVGDVLSGLATPHSDVQLHVFADHSEAFDFHLQDRGIPFELIERRFRYGRGGYHHYPAFRFSAGGVGFEAVLFPLTELRQAPNSLVDGAPLARAKIEEVARLLWPMMSPASEKPLVGGRWPATLTVLMGTISVVLTTTIVNVAVPGIMADFDMSQLHAQWLSTGFLAAMTATMLASARVVERLGQQRTFRITLWLFVAASLLAAASWSTPVMIAARILQGAVAGIIQPLALVVIFQVFPDDERGRALGLYGMGVVLAPAVGPAVGGWLMDVFNWRAVYLAALPFCAVGLWGAGRTLDNQRAETVVAFDWWGMVLLAAGLALLLGGLAELGLAQAWIPPGWLIAGGLGLLAGFLALQRRRASPLVNLDVFRRPAFALAFVLALVYGAGLFGSTYLLPLLVQGVQGLSATMTGLVLMPAGLALAMVFPVSGRLSDHWPAHRLIIAGLVLVALAFFALATTGPATGFVVLAAFILLGRIGLGLILPALNLDALRGLPDGLMQQGSGVINFARQLGGAFGVNLFALLLDWRVRQHLHAQGESSLALHNLYQPGAADPAGLQALTRGFAETFMVLGSCFVLAVIPAVAMGVRHARVRANSSGL